MKVTKTLTKIATAASSFVLSAGTVMAGSATSYLTNIDSSTKGGTDLISFAKSALNLGIALTALIAVGFLVYSGIQYVVAAGDDSKIEKATKGITYSVIGLIIAFISVLIVNFVLTELLGAA